MLVMFMYFIVRNLYFYENDKNGGVITFKDFIVEYITKFYKSNFIIQKTSGSQTKYKTNRPMIFIDGVILY